MSIEPTEAECCLNATDCYSCYVALIICSWLAIKASDDFFFDASLGVGSVLFYRLLVLWLLYWW